MAKKDKVLGDAGDADAELREQVLAEMEVQKEDNIARAVLKKKQAVPAGN